MELIVHPDSGRIGSFWWVNADTGVQHLSLDGRVTRARYVLWGSCGFGRTLRLHLELQG